MIKETIAEMLIEALRSAQRDGALPALEHQDPAIERPQNQEHGDYASSLPLKMARAARMSPLAIGDILRDRIPQRDEIDSVTVAAPGFINVTLDTRWIVRQIGTILSRGETYGHGDMGGGAPMQVEFVSVNPTGPIHVGHGRGAVQGSTMANLLEASGYSVQREYYVNDAGSQMDTFFQSLWARYMQALGRDAEFPAEGYHGAYVVELGKDLADEYGDAYTGEGGAAALGEIGMSRMLETIRADLNRINVSFDRWFSERSLFADGTYDKALNLVKGNGYTAEREGAVWFSGTDLGDERDSVLVRQTGAPTYFASDIAYHYDKFVQRGFEMVVNVWGADHQGHVPRMKAVVKALGVDPGRLQFILVQLVTLRRGDEVVRVSKRTGDIITLAEVINEVGPDACRYFFLARSADAHVDFDLDLAKKEAPDNPVYYIQYAFARIASILRNARESGLDPDATEPEVDFDVLTQEAEIRLARQMLRFPEVVETAARNLEPHHLPHYTFELAADFHDFYTKHRVLGETPVVTLARLRLVQAVQTVLRNSLRLMGMNAPEQM